MRKKKIFSIKYTHRYSYANFRMIFVPPSIHDQPPCMCHRLTKIWHLCLLDLSAAFLTTITIV